MLVCRPLLVLCAFSLQEAPRSCDDAVFLSLLFPSVCACMLLLIMIFVCPPQSSCALTIGLGSANVLSLAIISYLQAVFLFLRENPLWSSLASWSASSWCCFCCGTARKRQREKKERGRERREGENEKEKEKEGKRKRKEKEKARMFGE